MSLNAEWRARVEAWRRELVNHFYRELGSMPLSGFITLDSLSPAAALRRRFVPTPPGTRWGAKWEYGWFKGTVTLPAQAAGRRIVAQVDAGGESAIFVNGRLAGAWDEHHHEVTLSKRGVPGERYEILAEAYAGHGPRVCHVGPTPPGRITVPEPSTTQATVGECSFGIWEEEVYQLWMDVETLWHLRESFDGDSLRVAEVDRGLRDFTTIVDFEVERQEMLDSVRACRRRLKPLLDCVNGSTAPVMFAFGHAHIDVAWLWPLAETHRKVGRTMATQLALAEEYPEYRFLQSQPYLYRVLKERYPELYERLREAVKDGRVIPEGAAWVEPDTNITGGESLIRQFIHGKHFFRDEFGLVNEFFWQPDVFGYSAALPQIMLGCGVRYFATAKLAWRYSTGEPFPHNTFTWEGIDGSRVLAHLCYDYNSHTDPASVIARWDERVQKNDISTRLFPFGYGDGGGGPTRDHLEYLRRLRDLEGVPRTRLCPPTEFFKDLEARGLPEAHYVGELYLQCHRGTYTSQARTKKANRRSEMSLREAEMWGVAARALAGFRFPHASMNKAWEAVLLNQFHDILPGSAIHRVYEEAEAAHRGVLGTAEEVVKNAASSLTGGSPGLTVLNSLSWERTALVPLPKGAAGAADMDGKPLPGQTLDGVTVVEASLPPCGWTTLVPTKGRAAKAAAGDSGRVRATNRTLENELLRVEFGETGEVASIFDKEAQREVAAGACNSFKMYRDVPTSFDAWEIEDSYTLTPVELEEKAKVEVVATGPLVARLRITRRLNHSAMTQDVSLRRGSRRVDFHTTVDWQESHKLLKVAFPVYIHANEALHEIQFGHLRRPNHKSRPFDVLRFEVVNHKWTALMEERRGFAVLNDCKYGVNVLGNTIALTLLKSALGPDMTADKGMQEFTYAFLVWNGSFADSPVVREGYELNCSVKVVSGGAGHRTLFSVDAPNIIIETVKPPEDGSSDIIVRMYESTRTATRCTLSTSLPVIGVQQTDMLENAERELEWSADGIPLDFRAFEIKTLRLRAKPH
jgi:alpha-mannosidase